MITVFSAIIILISAAVSELPLRFPLHAAPPLASRSMSLTNRYPEPGVNEVFADNILLTLMYMQQGSELNKPIDWNAVRKPGRFSLTLQPGEVFTFHDLFLKEYQGKVVRTTNAHFNYQDGFRSSGYLYGDGVCHLASLMYWAALDAGLEAVAPVNHDFRVIPEVPREYGVSIYTIASDPSKSALQNLYITNNQEQRISFVFDYSGETVKIMVVGS